MRDLKATTLQEALNSKVVNVILAARTIACEVDDAEEYSMEFFMNHPKKIVRGSAYIIMHEITLRAIEDSQRPIPFSVEYSRCSHILLDKPRSLV